jgi:5-methylcytosine-specific restriction endonuclease McrA
MKFELQPYHRGVSDEEVIADVKRVAAELQKTSLTYDEYKKRGKYSDTLFRRRFGSWRKALELAGVDLTRTPPNTSEEELFQNLQAVWIKIGKQPTRTEMKKPQSKYHGHTYEKRFGSWRKVLERFVEYINQEQNISSKEAIEKLPIDQASRYKTNRDVNLRLRFIVMRRDNFKCRMCGRSPATDPGTELHVDHIKAWANGGETVLENLQTLCSKCNLGKSNLEL